MNEIILFLVSLMPVVFIGFFVYKKDKEKEPFKLLVKLFIGGIFSTVLAIILRLILDELFPMLVLDIKKGSLVKTFVYVVFKVALVEEVCRWLVTYKISWNNRFFNHAYDVIVYAVFVSLGFAVLENLMYISKFGFNVGIERSVSAIPGHAIIGVIMGFYMGLAKTNQVNKNDKLKIKYLILSLLGPIIYHTIYDFCLMSQSLAFLLLFVIFTGYAYKFAIDKINALAKGPIDFRFQGSFCPNCGNKISGSYCNKCGRKCD